MERTLSESHKEKFMELLIFIAALAFYVGCDIYDVVLTEKGIKAGVAVEGNTFLVGEKPSAVALYLRDAFVTGLVTAPCAIALAVHNAPFFWGGLVAPIICGVKHVIGGRNWSILLAGGKLPVAQSAWQKFLQG
jgi:hypothetical protein